MNVLKRDPHPQARGEKMATQDGSYKPDFSERSDGLCVSSMITSSNDKPCRQEDPNWGIASLIKQQEQLNESQPMETDGDSQDVDSHAPVTMNGISFQRMPDD
jgi:hypothetical protein